MVFGVSPYYSHKDCIGTVYSLTCWSWSTQPKTSGFSKCRKRKDGKNVKSWLVTLQIIIYCGI